MLAGPTSVEVTVTTLSILKAIGLFVISRFCELRRGSVKSGSLMIKIPTFKDAHVIDINAP